MGGGKGQQATPAPPPTFDFEAMMAAMMPPEMPQMEMPQGPSFEEQQEQRRLEQGKSDRDSAYTEYMDASSSATDYINSEITKEESNARLLGIDYQMDDGIKETRINDYFASVYGEGQQTKMEQLFDEFGKPKGFTDYTVKRGDATKYASDGGTKASDEVVSTTGVKKGNSPLADEDILGGKTSPLG